MVLNDRKIINLKLSKYFDFLIIANFVLPEICKLVGSDSYTKNRKFIFDQHRDLEHPTVWLLKIGYQECVKREPLWHIKMSSYLIYTYRIQSTV